MVRPDLRLLGQVVHSDGSEVRRLAKDDLVARLPACRERPDHPARTTGATRKPAIENARDSQFGVPFTREIISPFAEPIGGYARARRNLLWSR